MDTLAINANLLRDLDRFHEIVDGAAILCNKLGVYRQVKLFRRGNEIYAGLGAGFIRLMSNGNTSSPHTRYVGIDCGDTLVTEDKMGRLLVEAANG